MYKADAEILDRGNAAHILDDKAQIVAVSFFFLVLGFGVGPRGHRRALAGPC